MIMESKLTLEVPVLLLSHSARFGQKCDLRVPTPMKPIIYQDQGSREDSSIRLLDAEINSLELSREAKFPKY